MDAIIVMVPLLESKLTLCRLVLLDREIASLKVILMALAAVVVAQAVGSKTRAANAITADILMTAFRESFILTPEHILVKYRGQRYIHIYYIKLILWLLTEIDFSQVFFFFLFLL